MDTMSYVYLGVGGVLLIGIIVALFLNKDYLKYSGICKTNFYWAQPVRLAWIRML